MIDWQVSGDNVYRHKKSNAHFTGTENPSCTQHTKTPLHPRIFGIRWYTQILLKMNVSRDQVWIIQLIIIEINITEEVCDGWISEQRTSFWHSQNSQYFHLLNYHLSGCLITCLDLLCSRVKTEAWQRFDLRQKSSPRTDSVSRWKWC